MWKTVKLGDVFKTGAGGTPLKAKKEFYDNGNISWLLSGAVSEKEITTSKTFITEYGLQNSSAKIFPPNTVLVAMYGATAGQVGILRFASTTNQAVCGIYPNENYLPEFLYYFFVNTKDRLLLETSGVAQPNLSQLKIKNIRIPVLSISEQRRIVSKIDDAFAEIDKAIKSVKELLFNTNKLREKILNGWIENHTSAEDFYSVQNCIENNWIKPPFDGNHGESHPKAKDYKNNGIPFLMAKDLSDGEVDLVKCKFIAKEQALSLRVGFAKNNDVLLSHKGTIGEVALLKYENELLILTPQITAYRVVDERRVDRKFLYYFFKSNFFQTQLKSIAGIGSTRAYISISRQRDLNICLPSIDLQKNAVHLMTTIEPMLMKLYEFNIQKLDHLLCLKSSILSIELRTKSL